MTADQRLDQLEPLVSQTLAVADRHTAQFKQLVNLVTVQSDNIEFVLKELVEVKSAIAATNANVETTDAKIGALDFQVVALGAKVGAIDTKLDRILGLLSGNK